MPLQFVSHKEISFRQLLGMLRAPPVAVMNYYSNVFLSAKFVLSDQPEKVRFLDKEIRRVECMVGVKPTANSRQIQDEFFNTFAKRKKLEENVAKIEGIYESVDKSEQEKLMKVYHDTQDAIQKLNNQEHILLFKLEPLMDLKTMETYMDNNLDLKSFFKEHGRVVTQLEISSELDKIKNWVYDEAVKLMPYVRFTKLE